MSQLMSDQIDQLVTSLTTTQGKMSDEELIATLNEHCSTEEQKKDMVRLLLNEIYAKVDKKEDIPQKDVDDLYERVKKSDWESFGAWVLEVKTRLFFQKQGF